MSSSPLKFPNALDFLRPSPPSPSDLPDLSEDLTTSRRFLSDVFENHSITGYIYGYQLSNLSSYVFDKLHAGTYKSWVDFITSGIVIHNLEITHTDYEPSSITAARLTFVIKTVPNAHKGLIPKDNISLWLRSPHKKIRLAAMHALSSHIEPSHSKNSDVPPIQKLPF